jgi:TolB protein
MKRALPALAVVAALAACASSAPALSTTEPGRIAFGREFGENLNSEIWTADRTGHGRRRLIRIPHAAADDPAWSPSGQMIAFSVDRDPPFGAQQEIYVARTDGTGVRRLTGGAAKTIDNEPAWSPDGRQIAFTKLVHGGFLTLGVYVVRSDGRQHRLTRNRCDYGPAWSPNGKRVVLSRCGSLFVVNPDGTHARRLTRPPAGSVDGEPDWSPNGRLIAFVRMDGDDLARLYVIRPDGTGERRLTNGGDEHSPSWSPDGRLLAFATFTTIDTIAPRTGRTRMLVHMQGSDLTTPAWQR